MSEAIKVRLRVKGNVAAEASGGLDSSCIVLEADAILQRNGIQRHGLVTLSAVYEHSETCNETYFIKQLEERRGIKTVVVREDEQRFTLGLEKIAFTGRPNIFHLTPGRYEQFCRHMRTQFARVLLTGLGGDHIFCSTPYPELLVSELLKAGRFFEAHRSCVAWSRYVGVPYQRLLLTKALPLALSYWLPSSLQYDILEVPSWLRLVPGKDLLPAQSIIIRDKSLIPSQRFRIGVVESLIRTISAGTWNSYPSLYVSHPYCHRPLLDFCIGIPFNQLQRIGETRSLLRRAFVEILPKKIAQRKSKGDLFERFARTVQTDWHTIGDIHEWEVCQRGYVDATQFSKALHLMRLGMRLPSDFGFPPAVTVVERFLRSLSLLKEKYIGAAA